MGVVNVIDQKVGFVKPAGGGCAVNLGVDAAECGDAVTMILDQHGCKRGQVFEAVE